MYKLDNADALKGHQQLLSRLRELMQTEGERLRDTAVRSERLVQWRVQQEGRNTAGNEMVSKSRNRIGAYSQMAGLDRQSRGLQTDHIDLTVTGEMWEGWRSEPDGSGGYWTGFASDNAAYKADEVEMLFGSVFGLTDEEQQEALTYYNELSEDELHGR